MTELNKKDKASIYEVIDDIAKHDHMTQDVTYNKGLRKIRQVGYDMCSTDQDVKYYIFCNGFKEIL